MLDPFAALPVRDLDVARDAVALALDRLRRAEDVQWQSVAADGYRAELAELQRMVVTLTAHIDQCRDDWIATRSRVWEANDAARGATPWWVGAAGSA